MTITHQYHTLENADDGVKTEYHDIDVVNVPPHLADWMKRALFNTLNLSEDKAHIEQTQSQSEAYDSFNFVAEGVPRGTYQKLDEVVSLAKCLEILQPRERQADG